MPQLLWQRFGGLSSRADGPDLPFETCQQAENIVLEPIGTLGPPPRNANLWASSSMETSFAGGSGVVAYTITKSGLTFLIFYDRTNDRCVGGPFCVLRPASSYLYSFTNASATVSAALVTGLTSGYVWYGTKIRDKWYFGNGVDPVYVWYGGALVLCGTNKVPQAPTLSTAAIRAANAVVTQAFRDWSPGGGVTLRFTADSLLPGRSGHNIQVSAATSSNAATTSSLSGAGTSVDPYIYTITLKTGGETAANLVLFVTRDANASSVVNVGQIAGAGGTNVNASLAAVALASAVDVYPAVGLNGNFRVITTYYSTTRKVESGHSVSGFKPITTGDDLQILTMDNDSNFAPSADYNRLNIYCTIYDIVNAVHGENLVLLASIPLVPGGGAGAYNIRIVGGGLDLGGFNLGFYRRADYSGTDITTYDERTDLYPLPFPEPKQPPAARYFAYAGDRVWMAGVVAYPNRLYFSHVSTILVPIPENIPSEQYIEIGRSTNGGQDIAITAIWTSEDSLYVSTTLGIKRVNPDTATVEDTNLLVAAANQTCVVFDNHNRWLYLGRDFNVYSSEGRRTLPLSGDVSGYASQSAFAAEIYSSEWESATCYFERSRDLLWLWTKSTRTNNPNLGFVYYIREDSMTGPITIPNAGGVFRACYPFEDNDTVVVTNPGSTPAARVSAIFPTGASDATASETVIWRTQTIDGGADVKFTEKDFNWLRITGTKMNGVLTVEFLNLYTNAWTTVVNAATLATVIAAETDDVFQFRFHYRARATQMRITFVTEGTYSVAGFKISEIRLDYRLMGRVT